MAPCLVGRLASWFIGCLLGRSVGRLVGPLIVRSWLFGCLVGWLFGWLTGRSVGRSDRWWLGWLFGWLWFGWLVWLNPPTPGPKPRGPPRHHVVPCFGTSCLSCIFAAWRDVCFSAFLYFLGENVAKHRFKRLYQKMPWNHMLGSEDWAGGRRLEVLLHAGLLFFVGGYFVWSMCQTTLHSNVSFIYIHHRCLSWSGLHFTFLYFACRTAPLHRMRTRREAAAQVPRCPLKWAFLSGNHWVGHWLARLCLVWLVGCWLGWLLAWLCWFGWLAQPANAWSQAQGPPQREVGGGLTWVFSMSQMFSAILLRSKPQKHEKASVLATFCWYYFLKLVKNPKF